MILRAFLLFAGLVFLLGWTQSRAPQSPAPLFEDIARRSGLTVPHLSSPEKRYIIESISGGVGLFDCDKDGLLDIVIVNGSNVDRFAEGGDAMVTLYRQVAPLSFDNVTASAGLRRRGWGMGVAVADFDNDGWLDLYVTGYGGNVLYRNRGACHFEDVTESAGVRAGGFSTGAAWADYDRDGHVDLFVARYVHVDVNNLPQFGRDKFCRYKEILVQCGPWGLPGETDLLFHNRGDGTFEEVSARAGVQDSKAYYGLGAVWGDYDNDGWPDLYVANDAGPNYLYHNNGNGTFTDMGFVSGAALSGDGAPEGSMGVDFGDFDHDGRLDLFVTNFAEQANTLYRNQGPEDFADVSWSSRAGPSSVPYVGWGTAFFDYDNDGWLDIFVANGHVYPQVDMAKINPGYRQPLLLYRNNRDGTFDEISAPAGLAGLPLASRRGAAFGDLDNDGSIDIVLLNVGEPPSLLHRRLNNGQHRVLFKLEGGKSNRAGIGARVAVRAGDLVQFNEVRGGASYLSQNDLRLHFGLGGKTRMDSVEILWPSGKKDRLTDLPADRLYTVVESRGVRQARSLP